MGNHGYVAGYKGVSPEDVVISDSFEVDGSKRTTYGIKINAFKDNTNMKSVDIPAMRFYPIRKSITIITS